MATEVTKRKPTIYVVVNKSLGMSPPKLAAQVGHAVAQVMAHGYRGPDWTDYPHRWMIVLEANNGEHLYHISEYLKERGMPPERVIDEGVNEIPPFSLTAIGIGIVDKESESARYLSGLKKYEHRISARSDAGREIYETAWDSAIRHMQRRSWWERLRNRNLA